MEKSLLTIQQQNFLNFFNSCPQLYEQFYFSGGTALSRYYLQHRFSDDLDFFSEKEIVSTDLNLFLTTHKKSFFADAVQYSQSFNRNLFFLSFPDLKNELKVEFAYYPFTRLEKGQKGGNMQIDSVLDIAVNKVFTLTQQIRGRDFFDIYITCQKYGFDFMDLLKKAREKFDYPINYLVLGKNLIKVNTLLDNPILIEKIERDKMERYFLDIAAKLALFL